MILEVSQNSRLVNIDLFPETVMGFMELFTSSHEKTSRGLKYRKERRIGRTAKLGHLNSMPHVDYILMDLSSHSYNESIGSFYLFVTSEFYVHWLFYFRV